MTAPAVHTFEVAGSFKACAVMNICEYVHRSTQVFKTPAPSQDATTLVVTHAAKGILPHQLQIYGASFPAPRPGPAEAVPPAMVNMKSQETA